MKKSILLFVVIAFIQNAMAQSNGKPIVVSTKNLQVSVDASTCRWSASVKGTKMQINDVYFLPGDDPSGWKIVSSVNKDDSNNLGAFVTVTLHGKKAGQLDFDYNLSVSKNNNDIIVSLGRTNNTGRSVDIQDIDYFISNDARLGSTTDRWLSLGTMSINSQYYDLNPVITLIYPRMYIVNHVIKDKDSGNSLLMGQVTTTKGASRFEVSTGWQGKIPDRMIVRGYCNYKVSMPAGKSFPGEKLLIDFSTDALRSMEHQGDLIALAHDIRLKERRPIDLNDRELVANNYSRFHSWLSGGTSQAAEAFFKLNGLSDFYWGLGGPGALGSWGLYGLGGSQMAYAPIGGGKPGPDSPVVRAPRINYPDSCYLPVHTRYYGASLTTRVIDFSNPLTIKLERERVFQTAIGKEKMTGRGEMDYCEWWDKWPGQFDPYMSAYETYRAAGTSWRDVVDQKLPRMVIRSNMNVIDHTYGTVDICRISSDADRGYEIGDGWRCFLTEALLGAGNRFFYNGRVFWNDADGFHIYRFAPLDGNNPRFNAGQAKVSAIFHAIAGNTLFIEEAFDVVYPEDRIELMKRISPPTMDVSYPVDLFYRKPAQIYNMPIERPFGNWCVLTVFNFTAQPYDEHFFYTTPEQREAFVFSVTLDAEKDLRLDPNKEYIAYEFWSKQLIGTFKGTFVTRRLNPYDCDNYSIVEKKDHPVLISTSRHIRQMAVDIKDLAYDAPQKALRGVSRAVANDPYQLRIYVPEGFTAKRVELSDGLIGTMKTEGNLLTVDYKTTTGNDVEWKVIF